MILAAWICNLEIERLGQSFKECDLPFQNKQGLYSFYRKTQFSAFCMNLLTCIPKISSALQDGLAVVVFKALVPERWCQAYATCCAYPLKLTSNASGVQQSVLPMTLITDTLICFLIFSYPILFPFPFLPIPSFSELHRVKQQYRFCSSSNSYKQHSNILTFLIYVHMYICFKFCPCRWRRKAVAK